jgi:hypothetical protein
VQLTARKTILWANFSFQYTLYGGTAIANNLESASALLCMLPKTNVSSQKCLNLKKKKKKKTKTSKTYFNDIISRAKCFTDLQSYCPGIY